VFTNTFALTQPEVLVARAHEKLDSAGHLTDTATRDFLAKFLLRFGEWVAIFSLRASERSEEGGNAQLK
jgi:chromate reductase, NAD(P)H dehydrogenase (quinone)